MIYADWLIRPRNTRGVWKQSAPQKQRGSTETEAFLVARRSDTLAFAHLKVYDLLSS